MEFFNGTEPADFVGKQVKVLLTSIDGKMVDAAENCFAFEANSKLHIDIIPRLNRKYVFPVPEDACFSRNQQTGTLAVLVNSRSEMGMTLRAMINQKNAVSV